MKHVYATFFCLQIFTGLFAMTEKPAHDPRLDISFIVNAGSELPEFASYMQEPVQPHETGNVPTQRVRHVKRKYYTGQLLNRLNHAEQQIRGMDITQPDELTAYPYLEFRLLSEGLVRKLDQLLTVAPFLKDRQQYGTGNTLLHATCERTEGRRFACAIKMLFEHHFNVNARNLMGETPLHLALRSQHFGWAKLLLENGANPLIKNNGEETALDMVLAAPTPAEILKLAEISTLMAQVIDRLNPSTATI